MSHQQSDWFLRVFPGTSFPCGAAYTGKGFDFSKAAKVRLPEAYAGWQPVAGDDRQWGGGGASGLLTAGNGTVSIAPKCFIAFDAPADIHEGDR